MADRLNAIQFQQGVGDGEGQMMYLVAAPAHWLISRVQVDQWRPEQDSAAVCDQGYQRSESASHLKSIGRYLRGAIGRATTTSAPPVFPTSVLLAIREDADFAPAQSKGEKQALGWGRSGTLTIGDEQGLWVVDGQHRIKGLEAAIHDAEAEVQGLLKDYTLPVTIMVCKNKVHELIHFVTINKEAKNVRTDLAERLLDVVQTESPDLIADERIRKAVKQRSAALDIVRFLESEEGQPWFGRIAKPNERRSGDRVASEGQLTKSLRHICQAVPVGPKGWSEDDIKDFIVAFWSTLEQLLPSVFSSPRDFVLQRAVGFGALHRLLPNIRDYRDTDALKELLGSVEPYFTDPEYWRRRTGGASQYSSEGGYKEHAEKMLEEIRAQHARD